MAFGVADDVEGEAGARVVADLFMVGSHLEGEDVQLLVAKVVGECVKQLRFLLQ